MSMRSPHGAHVRLHAVAMKDCAVCRMSEATRRVPLAHTYRAMFPAHQSAVPALLFGHRHTLRQRRRLHQSSGSAATGCGFKLSRGLYAPAVVHVVSRDRLPDHHLVERYPFLVEFHQGHTLMGGDERLTVIY